MNKILQYLIIIVLSFSSSFAEPSNDLFPILKSLTIDKKTTKSVSPAPTTPIEDELGLIPTTHRTKVSYAILNTFPDYQAFSLKKMEGGLSIASLFELIVDKKKYVLRLLSQEKSLYKRKSEVLAHREAADLGLAPTLHYINDLTDPLVMIMDYIEGRTLAREDIQDEDLMGNVMTTLKKFHSISGIDLHQKNRMDSLEKTYTAYAGDGRVVYPSCYMDLLTQLKKDFRKVHTILAPVHGDFSLRNVLVTPEGKIFLIDFAEAHIGDFFVDFGWFSCVSGCDKKQVINLLKIYLQRDPSKDEMEKVMFFQSFSYFFLSNSWLRKQKERDAKLFDSLLSSPDLPVASEYVLKGITPEDILSSTDKSLLTAYALGFLKEYMKSIGTKTK